MTQPPSSAADAHDGATDGNPGGTVGPYCGGATVEVKNFAWRHGGRKAPTLQDVNLSIQPGEKLLLLGESGSGKSTLMAALAGVLGDGDEGESVGTIRVNGKDPSHHRGVSGLVMQDPDSQVISSRVGDDVAFGCENLGVPREEMWRRVNSALTMVVLDLPLDHPTAELSGGQKQRLAIAGVLAMGAQLILLDEPTANLDPQGCHEVAQCIEQVAQRTGATIIIVEHRVSLFSAFADRMFALGTEERGIIADGAINEIVTTHAQQLADRGVWIGQDPQLPPAHPVAPSTPSTLPTPSTPSALDTSVASDLPVALQTHDLAVGWDGSTQIGRTHTITIPRGASTVIVGPNGARKTTLALTLAGLLDPVGGSVVVDETISQGAGTCPRQWSSRQLACRIGYVFQDPEHQFVARTVREELEIGPRIINGGGRKPGLWHRLFGRHVQGELTEKDTQRIDYLLERLRLEHVAKANPFSLSGGQKRRLSVATALVSAPDVLILDEPTFGQDRRTFIEMIHLLRGLVDNGTTLISITHDRLFVQSMGDHTVEVKRKDDDT